MKRLSLLLLSFAILFAAAQARKRTFRMADYGVTPGAENLSAQMQKALAGIKAQVQPGDCVTLRFKKGTYNFHPQGAAVRTYYISNHDQSNPKHVAIDLAEWENLTLDGGGASFVCHGRMLPLALVHCKNTVLRNFSIDFAKPHITQVQVVANSPEGGITFRPAPWVDCGVDGGKFFAKGEGWQFNYGTGIAFNPETHHMVYRTSDLGIDLN
ncbi:MAG: alpha-1,3-galactosidase B, partial [Bacteroidales bacterium]